MQAARVVAAVRRGRSADALLSDAPTAADAGTTRAAVRAITLGSLRWYLRLAPAVDSLLARKGGMDPELHALLISAAHQIEYSRNPPERTVHEAVDAARGLGHAHATGMVNAVLRRFAAQRAQLLAAVDADPAAAAAHPPWLAAALQSAWPQQWRAILEANNAHPPLTLRVDLARTSIAACLAELQAAGLEGQALPWAPAAVRLATPVPVQSIPGFAAGRVSVQDAGAQLAAELLDARAGMRVLDACAAPGGKTLHILERTPDLAELVAADVDAARLARVRENLERAGRQARLLAVDMTQLAGGGAVPAELARPFDRILLDAPCSATGVIRRHPDIKLLRRPTDLTSLADTQLSILRRCFSLLAAGGRLLYCTCSVFPQENESVLSRFLEEEPEAVIAGPPALALRVPGAVGLPHGVQLLPGAEAATDGFYYACVSKP